MRNNLKKFATYNAILGIILIINPIIAYSNEQELPYMPPEKQEISVISSAFMTTTNLRLRTEPSLDADIIQTVLQGETVQVTDFWNGEWFAVMYNGISGYMYAEFLTEIEIPDFEYIFVDDTQAFAWPVQGPIEVNSPFGYRQLGGEIEFHNGMDLRASYGTNTLAAESGIVIVSEEQNGFGNTVVIYHGNGVSTFYAHHSINLVEVGQYVTRGDIIGKAGTSGRTTGAHLHFGVSVNGERVDPMPFLEFSFPANLQASDNEN